MTLLTWMPLILFFVTCIVLMLGFPVAFALGGTALLFAWGGALLGTFDPTLLQAMPNRLFGIMTNPILIAVPLFVFMGCTLQHSRLAETLLDNMARLFNGVRGGLGFSVLLVGMLLAASTGIVGATVVTLGLIALPSMLRRGYDPALATGTLCATGTLGQIIPPSIALVLLGDVLSNAYQQAQRNQGLFSLDTVSVADLFVGALVPGIVLMLLYAMYLGGVALFQPARMPATRDDSEKLDARALVHDLVPPLVLVVAVLGSILGGIATPTEAAAVGALGAMLLAALRRQLSLGVLRDVCRQTTRITSMVFLILIGASLFSLVFRGYGGERLVHELFSQIPGGTFGAMLLVMGVIFVLGFILDFIEITFVVVPIVAPVLLQMGVDPVWLGVMIALNLQTSFLTPPFGFALFFLRGVAPPGVSTRQIYRGVVPFILLQLLMLAILALWPVLATGLPDYLYG